MYLILIWMSNGPAFWFERSIIHDFTKTYMFLATYAIICHLGATYNTSTTWRFTCPHCAIWSVSCYLAHGTSNVPDYARRCFTASYTLIHTCLDEFLVCHYFQVGVALTNDICICHVRIRHIYVAYVEECLLWPSEVASAVVC